ncbi:MAG: RcnB family protein [Gammaproteobacteria bacterium]|nr:RcnB family protein [Gammaproteobacteria bacterium]
MAAMALSLLAGSVAFADPPGDHDHDGDHHEWRHDDHDRGEHRGEHWRDHDEYRHHERFDEGEYRRPHGYYVHHWHRGERLPIEYREPVYVVPDVAVYHLRPPPPGYYWVRVDNNAVLAAVATGLVVDVAVNLFH